MKSSHSFGEISIADSSLEQREAPPSTRRFRKQRAAALDATAPKAAEQQGTDQQSTEQHQPVDIAAQRL